MALSAGCVSSDNPQTYKEAVEKDGKWREAVDLELSSLIKNNTWEYVVPPPNVPIIDSRWVFTEKMQDDQPVKKARLVARGYQQPVDDGENCYSPVARIVTLRVLLSLAVQHDWHLRQWDVKSAFLASQLDSVVYLRPPERLEVPEGKVCRLNKALYGLRQSP
ncbi:unnamed protein product, partial [Nesidiocoris tenuis]